MSSEHGNAGFTRIASFVALTLVILLIVNICPYVVDGPSMSPTFINGDKLLVESLSPRLGLLPRGATIVYRDPRDPKHPIGIKRIIGLPTETIRAQTDGVSVLHKDGTEEMFRTGTQIGGMMPNGDTRDMFLGPEDYFLMGDNRDESTDSRHWGTIQPSEMIGRPLLLLSPTSRFKTLP